MERRTIHRDVTLGHAPFVGHARFTTDDNKDNYYFKIN